MQEFDKTFTGEYKAVEQICRDQLAAEKGIAAYLEAMKEKTEAGSEILPTWERDRKIILHLRSVRARIAHAEPGQTVADEKEIERIRAFHSALLAGKDPLNELKKAEQKREWQRISTPSPASLQTASSQTAPTASASSQVIPAASAPLQTAPSQVAPSQVAPAVSASPVVSEGSAPMEEPIEESKADLRDEVSTLFSVAAPHTIADMPAPTERKKRGRNPLLELTSENVYIPQEKPYIPDEDEFAEKPVRGRKASSLRRRFMREKGPVQSSEASETEELQIAEPVRPAADEADVSDPIPAEEYAEEYDGDDEDLYEAAYDEEQSAPPAVNPTWSLISSILVIVVLLGVILMIVGLLFWF